MTENDFRISRGDEWYWREMKRIGLTALKSERRNGQAKNFTSPEHLWVAACDYFQDTDMNPHQKEDYIRGGNNAGAKIYLNIPRPYTWAGLERYCIQHGYISSLQSYRSNKDGAYDEFVPIIAKINGIMFEQKFEGAAMGIFNANIISRDLNLVETTKTEHKISSDDIDYSQLSDAALAEITAQFEETKEITDGE